MAEDGVTTSGYGTEYAWQIRAVGYSLVGDEVLVLVLVYFVQKKKYTK